MLPPSRLVLFTSATLILAVGLCSGRADDAEAVKEKLFQAKKAYDAEILKFRQSVSDWLDKRETDARKAGNKKLVDQIKDERAVFEKTGELPATIPPTMREAATLARTKLDQAYTAAVKEFLRFKADEAADATEKERKEFLMAAAILYGKRTFVTSLRPFNIKVENNMFVKDSSDFKMNGIAIPHSLLIHAEPRGEGSVSYNLPPRVVAFQAGVGVPKYQDSQQNQASPITFEVVGDGKILWKSEPVGKLDMFQNCSVLVEKVKVLTLRIRCEDYHWSHAVWFGPVLAE